MFWEENEAAVILKTGRFDSIDLAVIISSVCEAVQNCLSKRPVSRITAVLFLLLSYFRPIFIVFQWINFVFSN